MTENNRSHAEKPNAPEAEIKQEEINKVPVDLESEFKITVRKLEMPVKPRGVLAE